MKQLAFDDPSYTVHCFFDCGHRVSTTDPDESHEQMEQHYSEQHGPDIHRALTVDPPSPSDPPQRRSRRR
ncbi:hypothetical protein [Streptomyces sp. NPDC004721]